MFDRFSPDATRPARVVDYSRFGGSDGPRTATSAGRQDFDAIAMLIAGGSDRSLMSLFAVIPAKLRYRTDAAIATATVPDIAKAINALL